MIGISWGRPLGASRSTYDAMPFTPSNGLVRTILQEVAAKHGFTYSELTSDRRSRKIAYARQEVMWRASKETRASLPMIASILNRDHTTVLYGIRKHEERMKGTA